jgi:hypothetical protein
LSEQNRERTENKSNEHHEHKGWDVGDERKHWRHKCEADNEDGRQQEVFVAFLKTRLEFREWFELLIEVH